MSNLTWQEWRTRKHPTVRYPAPCLGEQWLQWDENCRLYAPWPNGYVSNEEEARLDISRCLAELMDFFEVQILTGIADDLSYGTVLWTLESYLTVCLVLHYPFSIPITPKLYLYLRRLLSQILKRFSGRQTLDVMGHLPKPVLY